MSLGSRLGIEDGFFEGMLLGLVEGKREGMLLGDELGFEEGSSLGISEGDVDGVSELTCVSMIVLGVRTPSHCLQEPMVFAW